MMVHDRIIGKDVEQVDETDVVRIFKKSSPEFDLFYHEERMKKLGMVLWRVDPEIDPANKMRSITFKDEFGINYPIIYMNNPDIPIEDVFIVAHEIMHCVLTQEGRSLQIFAKADKFTSAENGRKFASEFQTMLEDSAVDSILQNKYNFDALRQYMVGLDLSKKERRVGDPSERGAQIYMAFNITNNILKWQIIKDANSMNDWCAFLENYKINHPRVSEISDQILSIIEGVGGLDTVEQKKSVFLKISEKFNLSGILTISPPDKSMTL